MELQQCADLMAHAVRRTARPKLDLFELTGLSPA
jgi:hypothetical protein